MKHAGLDEDAKSRMLDLLRAKITKRTRKATNKGECAEEEKDKDGDEGDADNDDDAMDVAEHNPFVKSLPESEVAFALQDIPAGMALNDEEGDQGWPPPLIIHHTHPPTTHHQPPSHHKA